VIEYIVNPYLRLKVQRDLDRVISLSLSAPVRGRGLQRNELKRGDHGREMDTLVSVLSQLRRPEYLQQLTPETSGALTELGVLVPAAALPDWPRFECELEAVRPGAASGEFLRRKVRELVRREAPGSSSSASVHSAAKELPGASAIRWVKYAPAGIWLPYAIPADWSDPLDRALDDDGVVTDLGIDAASALLEPSGAEHGLRPAVADLRLVYAAREHCSLSGLLPESWRRAFADYYARLVAQGFWAFDDGQSARYWAHNEPMARVLHAQLAPVFAEVLGIEIMPSYAYSCWYADGARLEIHTDRPQCGYTASLLVASTAASEDVGPWPLGIVNPTTRETARYVQSNGEAVLFCGTRYPHFREAQPGGRVSTCVFFHYVTRDFAGTLA
jgi:hypothetical protein